MERAVGGSTPAKPRTPRRRGGLRVWIRRPRRDARRRRVYRRGCVVPAGRGAVDVRIFSQRSVCLPRSPRAAPNGGVGAFAYATEGRVYDALPGAGGFGRTESKAAVLGVGLTLPRGAAVACLVDGDATRALSATSSSVACDVPPGPSGFVVVAVSDAVGSVQTTRSQPPRTYAAYPSAVDAGGGGVLSLAGVDMHRAVGFTFGGDDGAMVSSALGVVVSSALAVVEAPGAEKVVRRPADDAAVAVAVGATRGDRSGTTRLARRLRRPRPCG